MRKDFSYTLKDQINLSMSYISYTGEMLILDGKQTVEEKMLEMMRKNISSVEQLCIDGAADWEIIWGPSTFTFKEAVFQSNMMYVTQQVSKPDNYIICIRGTNIPSLIEWIKEDFDVWHQVEWEVPECSTFEFDEKPKISNATDRGLKILLNKMIPEENLPGAGTTITGLLQKITKDKCNISLTGHSLGGALTSALSLYLKEYHDCDNSWDVSGESDLELTTFASPTIGNKAFADYFDAHLGGLSRRIWNTLDIIPHAWEAESLKDLPDMYKQGGIDMPWGMEAILKIVETTVPEYAHTQSSLPFTWHIDKEEAGYIPQAFDQHADSYPEALNVPILKEIFRRNIPKILD